MNPKSSAGERHLVFRCSLAPQNRVTREHLKTRCRGDNREIYDCASSVRRFYCSLCFSLCLPFVFLHILIFFLSFPLPILPLLQEIIKAVRIFNKSWKGIEREGVLNDVNIRGRKQCCHQSALGNRKKNPLWVCRRSIFIFRCIDRKRRYLNARREPVPGGRGQSERDGGGGREDPTQRLQRSSQESFREWHFIYFHLTFI